MKGYAVWSDRAMKTSLAIAALILSSFQAQAEEKSLKHHKHEKLYIAIAGAVVASAAASYIASQQSHNKECRIRIRIPVRIAK